MKTKLLFAVGLLLAFNSFGQNNSETTSTQIKKESEPEKKEEEKETEENEDLKEINETLKKLEEKIDGYTDKKDSIGYVELTTTEITTYKNYQKGEPHDSIGRFLVDAVSIEIRNGTITSLFVRGKEKGTEKVMVFNNSRTFIELSEINVNRCDMLEGIDSKYILICDFLTYIGSRAFPSDTSYVLNITEKQKAIHIKTGLNNVFQARIYSDLLGLAGDESNGLLQSEVSFKSNLHNRNVRNSPFYFGHYVSAEAGLARFDSKFRTINGQDLNLTEEDSTTADSTTIDYMDIYQQSFVFSTLKINVFEWFVNRSYSSFSFNAITGLNAARYQDSASLPVRRINMPYYGGEVLFHAKPYDNFGLIASYTLRHLYFFGIEDKKLEGGTRRPTYTVNMEMYWNPMGKETNRLFARFRYTDMFGPSQPFSQFQVGYAVNFSEWVKAKK